MNKANPRFHEAEALARKVAAQAKQRQQTPTPAPAAAPADAVTPQQQRGPRAKY
ncbi:hypothetical protein OG936_39905 (plasmid) [Streptomyces sp. NBC_00846]|uniref:hypothetical protein n=1 Tax=Streptomyces sp. NBC_00846 TaxID=2975849 RepID=UPI003866C336|nr:hypothetical protein OG936_39905 [Streptomyces sp. NBC_00846]